MKTLLVLLFAGCLAGLARAQAPAADLTELITVLQGRFVDSDQLDAKRVSEATVAGLLQAIGSGAQLLTATEAAANSATRPVTKAGEALARAEIIQPDIGYIRLADVTEATPAALDGELQNFLAAKVSGYVLDLRFADGTNYAAAASVASRFIGGEPELFFFKVHGQPREMFRASEASRTWPAELRAAPVMVLVNHATRGAAETVAAALRAQDRAIIIGSPTAGQALAWEDVPLTDGRVLRVATAKISIVGGPDIFPGGLTPDIMVQIDAATEHDAVVNAATNITLTASLQPVETKKGMREADLMKFFRGEAFEPPTLTLGTNVPLTETNAPISLTTAGLPVPATDPNRTVRDTVLQRAVDILKGIRVLLSSR